MNEVEAHYASQSGGTGSRGSDTGGSGSGPIEAAKSALGQAASTAKVGLKSVKDQARSATGAARESAGDAYGKASDWGRSQYGSATRTMSDATRKSAAGLSRGRRGVETFVEENPIMVGVVGLAAGLIIGALLPGTRRENQVFGRYADEARDQGLRYARDLAEQGKQFVEENLDATLKGGQERGEQPDMA